MMKKRSVILSAFALLMLCTWGGRTTPGSGLEKVQETRLVREDTTVVMEELMAQPGNAQSDQKKIFAVTAFAQPQLMYASNAVNMRSGPSTSYGRVGGLARAQEVSVSGQADTGWYEVDFNGTKAYVSNKYLQNEKPAAAPAAQAAPTGAGVILVGDSRFVQMQENVGENSCVWIAQSGKGYQWFSETAMAQIDGAVGNGSKIVINLGVNDPGNLNKYIELVNAKAQEWVNKGAVVYYASVNPVWENPHVTEEQVVYFNTQMVGSLSGNVRWIDSYSYLQGIGYKLVDGLHFNSETYQNIYNYLMSCL